MSVTFTIRGLPTEFEDAEGWVNLSNSNAYEVLAAVGLDSNDLAGSIRGRDLRVACEYYLAHTTPEPYKPGTIEARPGCATMIQGSRAAGYVSDRVLALLSLAVRAGDLGVINYG